MEWKPENNAGDYVVHPPLGKWCIALGEWIFGYNSFGWRISAAVAGIVSILLIVRIARRLFRSTMLGCAAGLLLTLDGLHFVLSRAALLDIFLMTFVLAAFGCVVLDRDQRRRRLLAALEAGRLALGEAPRLGVPWWRFGVASVHRVRVLGEAERGVLHPGPDPDHAVLRDRAAALGRRAGAVGVRHDQRRRLVGRDRRCSWSTVYLASWTGWFVTDYGWNRHGARGEDRHAGHRSADQPVGLPPQRLRVPYRAATPSTTTSPGRGSGC